MMKRFSLLFFLMAFIAGAKAQQFRVSYPASAFKGPFSGHVILYISKTDKEPRVGIEGPCYGLVVNAVKPGETVIINEQAIFYPVPLSRLESGTYFVQAVWDRDMGGRNIGTSQGNLYSAAKQITLTGGTTMSWDLNCDQVVPEPLFTNSTYDKELKVPSKLLSRFFHHPLSMDGAVILPAQYYTEPKRHFPVLFVIGGYGADYHHYSKENGDTAAATPLDTIACIRVYLDGNCPLGHMVYANSDNNGPWADVTVKEFIPALEKKYRCDDGIVMKGHSSGAWAVLWLQIHYPNVFAGCNASAPDYVDFRSLNERDYYQEVNTIRHGGKVPSIVQHPHVEDVLYRGEQDRSFDAVYGPRGTDGNPVTIRNMETGVINPAVFEYWKRYDISLYLRNNMDKLRKDLYGKVRVSVGNEDTYHLNFAVEKLEAAMKSLNTGFQFAYYPGNHYSVVTTPYKKDEAAFLVQKYQEWLKRNKQSK